MSLIRPFLNTWLRYTEKPHLARSSDPVRLRKSFATKARLFFHVPHGTERAEILLGGSNALAVTPKTTKSPKVLLYIHGGAFIFGSPSTHFAMVARLCSYAGLRAVLPEYRKAPEHPFPAALDDSEAVYLDLIQTGTRACDIIIGGDSAGGGLALSLMHRILQKGHPIPSGLFALSPITDLTYSSQSLITNAQSDVVLPASQTHKIHEMYLADHDPKDPEASPLWGTFKDAPPIYITVGDTEILLDDACRMQETLCAQGVDVTFKVEQDLPHVWPIFHNILPEGRATLRDIAKWIKQLPNSSDES